MILIEPYRGMPVTRQSVEIVERKGTGHPDQICDCVMDAVSVALCKAYLHEFGTILHHNVDKGLLAAGRVSRRFGGGEVLAPMELIIGDRATFAAGGKEIPVVEIAEEAARGWIRSHLRHVDPARHVKYSVKLAPGSQELSDIFERPGEVKGANDTSAAVGYYPLTPTEEAVLALERELNSDAFKTRNPETGEDVKVMGLRREDALDVTVAMPLLAEKIAGERQYFEKKESLLREMTEFMRARSGFSTVEVHFNTLDERGRGLGGVYLSLLGTSAEDADSGQVGRGNRVNGIIAMNRPMGTEAAAGKNPVSHVGKIYNVLAHRLAMEICREVEGVQGAYVLLLSRIGAPISSPLMANAQLLLEEGQGIEDVSQRVEDLLVRGFSTIIPFCMALSRGEFPIS